MNIDSKTRRDRQAKRIIEQLELTLDLDEIFIIDISDELEMQLKSLAKMHNMNRKDYLAGRFRDYLEKNPNRFNPA